MANFKNTDFYKVTNAKTTVPAPANGTGTIETVDNKVVGTGTSFLTGMKAGSWLVKIASDEIRKVISVKSDTEATLSEAFTIDISSGATPSIISPASLNFISISVGILSGLTDGEIDGTVFDNGTSVVFTKAGAVKTGSRNFVDPIIIDGVGTVITVVTLK